MSLRAVRLASLLFASSALFSPALVPSLGWAQTATQTPPAATQTKPPVTQAQPAAPPHAGTAVAHATPPLARQQPHRLEKHGDVRNDDFFWLKERENPEVLAYLKAENAYTEAEMAHTKQLQEDLYQEIVGRIQADDATVPAQDGKYWYHERYVEGGEYAVYCRHPGGPDGPEQTMLDGNALARGHEFFSCSGLQVSPNQELLAYGTDVVGRRFYTLRVRNLTSGKDLPDIIPDVTNNCAWAADNRTLFYTKQDAETLRWYRIYAHVLGTAATADRLVYEEPDAEFSCFVGATKSKRFLLIGSEQTLATEYRFLRADQPQGTWTVFLPRETDHEYSIEDWNDDFVIRTNWKAKNFCVMRAPIGATQTARWTEVVPHQDDVFVEGVEVFRDHLVVSRRRKGLLELHVVPRDGSPAHDLDFGEPAYQAYPTDNREYDTPVLRYAYTSLTTPKSIFDYDLNKRTKKLLKEDAVLGGFDKRNYVTERLWAPAADGARVPISLVVRRDFVKDGSAPLLLTGYGSYGFSRDASFQSQRLSLLDRGFVFAIAHVRGGQELGRDWYENGKLMHKKNTFTDFIDCGRFLVAQKYTSPERLFAEGGSAGGLLMGAVANMAPELFKGIISHVPFVDVVTTMLDADIPLTTGEYDEWGDPNDAAAYRYMLSYSPYDNLQKKAYPNMLITTGLHDSQVQYWEPAKYVAKLRRLETSGARILLQTNMDAGHGGASGRFKRHRETALGYAFLLDLSGRAALPAAASKAGAQAARP